MPRERHQAATTDIEYQGLYTTIYEMAPGKGNYNYLLGKYLDKVNASFVERAKHSRFNQNIREWGRINPISYLRGEQLEHLANTKPGTLRRNPDTKSGWEYTPFCYCNGVMVHARPLRLIVRGDFIVSAWEGTTTDWREYGNNIQENLRKATVAHEDVVENLLPQFVRWEGIQIGLGTLPPEDRTFGRFRQTLGPGYTTRGGV